MVEFSGSLSYLKFTTSSFDFLTLNSRWFSGYHLATLLQTTACLFFNASCDVR